MFIAIYGLAKGLNQSLGAQGTLSPRVSTGITLTFCILWIVGVLIKLIAFIALVFGVIAIYQMCNVTVALIKAEGETQQKLTLE